MAGTSCSRKYNRSNGIGGSSVQKSGGTGGCLLFGLGLLVVGVVIALLPALAQVP